VFEPEETREVKAATRGTIETVKNEMMATKCKNCFVFVKFESAFSLRIPLDFSTQQSLLPFILSEGPTSTGIVRVQGKAASSFLIVVGGIAGSWGCWSWLEGEQTNEIEK
jgi:hypothetical protein